MYLRILVYWVIYDSGQVSLEHLLLSWYHPLRPTNPESITTVERSSPQSFTITCAHVEGGCLGPSGVVTKRARAGGGVKQDVFPTNETS